MDIKERIEKRFNKKVLNFQKILEMIEQQLDEDHILSEAPTDPSPLDVQAGKELILSLPKFSPAESWGDPKSIDRKNVDQLFKVIPGPASLQAKLDYIATIQKPNNRITSPRRIIGTLIILESLNAVVNSFGASTAGYVFEGFLAALLGGKQVYEKGTGGSLPIQDIIAFTEYGRTKNVPMSLKILKRKTDIKGSYTNLVDALNHYERMVYIVAYKTGGDRNVSEVVLEQFAITRDNLLDFVTQNEPSRKRIFLDGMNFKQSLATLRAAVSWEERYALLQQTAGYTGKVEAPPEEEEIDWSKYPTKPVPEEETMPVTAESLRKLWDKQLLLEGADGGTQWHISTKQLGDLGGIVEHEVIGTLKVSPDAIYSTAASYLDVLGDVVTDLFSAVASLSDNLNKYFLTKERGEAIARGNDAVDAAKIVEAKATARVEKERAEKEI